MILGLSHIAFNCANIPAATKRLQALGYAQRFDAPDLENHVAKVPFLAQHQPLHDIRAMAAEGAMAIELLNHGALTDAQSAALIPVFRSAAPCPDWQACALEDLPITAEGYAVLRDALQAEPLAFYDAALSAKLLWIPAQGEADGLYACAAPTEDCAALETLLGQLRFRPDAAGMWSLLTPLPALLARLVPVAYQPLQGWSTDGFLDAPGCACMALMARGTDRAPLPPALQGPPVSFSLRVNEKDTRIILARPEHGPIIELVEQPT